jgi:hypothetical protein
VAVVKVLRERSFYEYEGFEIEEAEDATMPGRR